MRQHGREHSAGVVRRHDADDDLGAAQRVFEAVGGDDGSRDRAVGEKQFVDMARVDAFADFGFMRPETHVVATATAEDDGDGGSPRSGTNDGNAAQAAPDFPPPKRFSLPAIRRRMLSLWRTMMSREEAEMKNMMAALRV